MYIDLHVRYSSWIFWTIFWKKNILISNFMKIHCLGVEFYRADGQTDATKPIVALRNFAYAPKLTDWPRSSILETSVVWFSIDWPPRLPTRTSDPTIKPTRFDLTRRQEENAAGIWRRLLIIRDRKVRMILEAGGFVIFISEHGRASLILLIPVPDSSLAPLATRTTWPLSRTRMPLWVNGKSEFGIQLS